MIKKVLTLALTGWLLAAMGCATVSEPRTGSTSSEPGAMNLVVGGVLVVFGNVGTVASPEYCPIGVMTTDDECVGKGPDYVCRWAANSVGASEAQKRVRWSAATVSTGPPPVLLFNIDFTKSPFSPCQNAMGSEAATKVCVAKNRSGLGLPPNPPSNVEVDFEYSVTSGECDPRDPFIVFGSERV